MKIFTNDYIDSLTNPSEHFERGISSLIATSDYFEPLRTKLENIIIHINDNKKGENIINHIRSNNDNESLSAISELIVFDHLQKEFDKVEIEIPLKQVDGKTPDFWVDNSFAVEVATIFNQEPPVVYEIIEALNKIKRPLKLMLSIDLLYWDRNTQLKVRDLRNKVIDLFSNNSDIKKITPFRFNLNNGVQLRGSIYRGKTEHPTVGSFIQSHGFHEDEADYKKIARKKILAKSRKYRMSLPPKTGQRFKVINS